MRSIAGVVPVVSRSRIANGLVSFKLRFIAYMRLLRLHRLLSALAQVIFCRHLDLDSKAKALLTSSAQFSLQGIDKGRLAVFSGRAGGTMAEVGLLPFARVALQVATQVLPPYRSRFSKHQFTQPQLLAVLCLMRYEDWTFREAEVRLREHQELRATLRLRAVPDYTTLYRFLRRLEDDTVDRGLQETVRRLRRRRSRPISAAIDGTGLSDTSVSTFFHRRLEQHVHGPRPRRPWLKWLIVVDVQQQILLAQRARQGPGCDARALPGLLDVAARGAPIGVVLADAEFDSEANHQHIRQRLGAKSIIPARRRGVPNGAIRNQMFRAFPKKPYRQRAKIESIFSAVKRKLSSRAPGRSLATQVRQALSLGLAYNLYRLRHPFAHRGCQQSPSVANKRLARLLSPLDSALTKNRGWGPPPCDLSPFNPSSLLLSITRHLFTLSGDEGSLFSSSPFNDLHTLLSSVSRKSFACHSYEN